MKRVHVVEEKNMMKCKACGKLLKQSQYEKNNKYKSCPRCSVINGEEHVFFSYPEDFGKSNKRETANHPDGPQSYCYTHRPNPSRGVPVGGILCSQLKNEVR